MQKVKVTGLLDKAEAATRSAPYEGTWNENRRAKMQLVVDGDGAVTAEFSIEGSNDNIHWQVIGTASLSGTDTDSDTVDIDYPWAYVVADLTVITGTDAKASALLSM